MADARMTGVALKLVADGPGETGAPAANRLISGSPVFTTWNCEEREDRLFAGVWQSTPGKWRIAYEEWEFFHILCGVSIVTGDDGTIFRLAAGDNLILRPGFSGTWEVIETTRKEYVILV